jgi:hypothetical protein
MISSALNVIKWLGSISCAVPSAGSAINRKIAPGRVNIVRPIVFVSYAAANPEINRIIWLVEREPPRRRLLQPLIIISNSFLLICNYVSHHDPGSNPRRSWLIRKDDLFYPATGGYNFCADCASDIAEHIAYDHTWVNQDILGGRMANISIFEIYHYRDGVAINSKTHGFSFVQLNPCSLSGLHLDQLSLNRLGLIAQHPQLVSGRLVAGFPSSPHLFQLTIKDPGRPASCNGRQQCENSGRYKYDYRYSLALGSLALAGFAAAAISVYRIRYGIAIRLLDICALFVGGVMFIGGVASCLGYTTVYSVLQQIQ